MLASAEIPHVVDVSVLRLLIRQEEEQRYIQKARKDRHLIAEARKGYEIEKIQNHFCDRQPLRLDRNKEEQQKLHIGIGCGKGKK